MRSVTYALILFVISSIISGCSTYSGLVNRLGPEKPVSSLLSTEYLKLITGNSPFCPVREIYMVMPEDGKEGTVSVTFEDGREVTLHGDYSTMSLSGSDQKVYVSDQDELQELFGTVVAALPDAPYTATLYFQLGSVQLAAASRHEVNAIYDEIKNRRAPFILLIGHSDTLGTTSYNERLSLKRAEKIKQDLITLGLPSEAIEIKGLGETQLRIDTPDNTSEPMNRRVDINVR